MNISKKESKIVSTIRANRETKKRLRQLEVHPRETEEQIINRLIDAQKRK